MERRVEFKILEFVGRVSLNVVKAMMDTKVTFGKTNKRQGYHIIISFAPGEATEEQALDIVARFAQEYLKDKYEAVYAVHNDKKHMHGHIVFNSVSFETGMKHECRKGEWKHRMQPITNRLCKEYGLSIVPAEYVKEPKNLSRKEWEREQCFRKMILADAEFCQSQAGSFDIFPDRDLLWVILWQFINVE